MYLTSEHICFYSKILATETILIIKVSQINAIVKTMHALIFPTAIRIETRNSSYSFTSFRSRSNTLEHLINLLNESQQKQLDMCASSQHFDLSVDLKASNESQAPSNLNQESLVRSEENLVTADQDESLALQETSQIETSIESSATLTPLTPLTNDRPEFLHLPSVPKDRFASHSHPKLSHSTKSASKNLNQVI